MAARSSVIRNLMRRVSHGECPCHSCQTGRIAQDVVGAASAIRSNGRARQRSYAVPLDQSMSKEYAFELSASNLRFGEGVTREVGMDLKNLGARKVGVYTDPGVSKLLPLQVARESLEENGVPYEIYDKCRVEPNLDSWNDAISFAKQHDFSHFLAVGGGVSRIRIAN